MKISKTDRKTLLSRPFEVGKIRFNVWKNVDRTILSNGKSYRQTKMPPRVSNHDIIFEESE